MLNIKMPDTRSKLYLFTTFGLVYLIAVIFSNGYYHPDEHYQLIEFAGLKLDWNSAADLTWEFDRKIRPTLQPFIAVAIFKSLGFLGIKDAFILSGALRFFSACFSFLSIYLFTNTFKGEVKEKFRIWFYILSFCLWFLPSVNVRFSSETWCGNCLIIAIVLIRRIHTHRQNPLWIGIFLGLAFEFRFQSTFATIGLLAWLILISKIESGKLLWIITGGILILSLGIALDSCYYGQVVITPYEYFKANLMDGIASNYGTSPWHNYIHLIIVAPTAIIGSGILFSLVWSVIYLPKHIIVWAVFPFILLHTLIPHKELRFLFPIINLVPLLITLMIQYVDDLTVKIKDLKLPFRLLLYISLATNMLGLISLIFKPAGNGSANMIRYIDRKYKQVDSVSVYCLPENNPYVIGSARGLKAKFYLSDNIILKDINWRNLKHPKSNAVYLMPLSNIVEGRILEKNGFRKEYIGLPEWIIFLNHFYGTFDGQSVPALYTKQTKN
ncbi:mannosyltransferase [Pedobacter sp. KBS0701]|uniref:mannosyltransferase n=1 Tax=Pedobacter sp. KBS0701 TaxID=2578106 RepID=UPI00110D42BC|nr:mannosyltransferase [Pedobacter sp. KBS0701]QDW24341.1 mannosyltransferase [Pedobacter sp. KBS0701]